MGGGRCNIYVYIDMSYLKWEFPFLSEVDGLVEEQAVPFWLKLFKHLGGASLPGKQGQKGEDH